MDADYFINRVRQVVYSYARMHAAIMEWPRFTLELYEVLVTKFKTLSDSTLFHFFQLLQKRQCII